MQPFAPTRANHFFLVDLQHYFFYSTQFKTGQDQSLNYGQKKKKERQELGREKQAQRKCLLISLTI